MMILFNARLDIDDYSYVSVGTWTIHGIVIDNSGNFIANSAEVGNIIYINDSVNNQILRYKVTSLDAKTSGADLYATIVWDMGNTDPIDPLIGYESIIGAASGNLGLITLTSGEVNYIGASFLNSIRNYENFQILDRAASNTNIIPTKVYTALENIDSYKILYINDNDQVGIADFSNVECADRIIGMSLETKLAGEDVKVQLDQKIQNKDWSFAKTGETVFVGTNGNFTLTPDSNAKFIQEIGIIVSNDSIQLNIEDAVML